jgi:hypothetical protein
LRLERALVITLVLHAVAMLGMAALLLPTLPGGGVSDDLARVVRIGTHPWLFRLGWLPWHLTALSDLYLAYALLRTPWISRALSWLVVVLTIVAVIFDQGAQLAWVTVGTRLATDAANSHELREYLAFEAKIFPLTGAWAALFYTLGALGWSACFARAGTWTRMLTWLSVVLWSVFLIVSVGPLLPSEFRLPAGLAGAGNAIGFVLLEVWLLLVLEEVLRREVPFAEHGRWALWRAPRVGLFGRVLEWLANSRAVRVLCSRVPSLAFQSDITNVVYVNYVVEIERLLPLVPEGLEIQRLGPDGRWALFTFLTYRHGHFGPRVLGPLRKLFASPVQSNWRIYVRDPRTGREGIYFVTNAVTTRLHSLGARLMSEGMPMHLLAKGEVTRADDGTMRVVLDPGTGTAPDAELELRSSSSRTLPEPFSNCFASYEAFLANAVPQDRAMSTLPHRAATVRQEIHLGIPLDACEPLEGSVHSRAAERWVGPTAKAVCFRVPSVHFLFDGEELDGWSQEGVPSLVRSA